VAMGEIKAGLARTNVLLIHLVGVGRKLLGPQGSCKKRSS